MIDGNWKFDWQVFDVLVVDFELAARLLETGNDEVDRGGQRRRRFPRGRCR